ncbi:MAG: hypothetical protein R6W79_00655, partial [Acidimicrobiia bacterium]
GSTKGGPIMQRRYLILLIAIALLVLAVVPAALAGPKGTDRPFKGSVPFGPANAAGTTASTSKAIAMSSIR